MKIEKNKETEAIGMTREKPDFFYNVLLYKHVKTVVQIDVYGKSINFIFKKYIYTLHMNSNILYITEDICITGCSDQLFT